MTHAIELILEVLEFCEFLEEMRMTIRVTHGRRVCMRLKGKFNFNFTKIIRPNKKYTNR